MRIYLLHKKGKIDEIGDSGFGFDFNPDEIRNNYPEHGLLEIDEKTYKKISSRLEDFRVVNDKVVEKTEKEKGEIKERKKKWVEEHSLEGLRQKVKKLENKFEKQKRLSK